MTFLTIQLLLKLSYYHYLIYIYIRVISKDLNAFDIIFKTIEYVKKNPDETESLFRMLLLFSYQRSELFFFLSKTTQSNKK